MKMATLEEYGQKTDGKACRSCGTHFINLAVEHYDHPGGWEVDGFDVAQWLYITCPDCDYQNSLWKLGVPR